MRHALTGHSVSTAYEMGWHELDNGALLNAVEAAFDVFIMTDQSLRYQQNLAGRRLAIIVLPTTSWPTIQVHVAEVVAVLNGLSAGDFRELTF